MSRADIPSRRRPRSRIAVGVLAVLALAALIAAACGGVSNDDLEADEFIRPPARGVADLDAPAQDAPDDGADADAVDQSDGPVTPDNLAPTPSSTDGGSDDTGDLQLAEDIVRRYRNPTYGYSLELVCGPFCDINAGGVDRVGFTSDTEPALINIATRTVAAGASLDDLQLVWQQSILLDTTPSILARQEVRLASDGVTPALIIDWEIDRRATGGSQERWRSLITQVGPIAYFINAGALGEFFDGIELFLQQSLNSFLALPNPDSLPGFYTRFDFALAYDVDGFVGELPLSGVANRPTADGGRFFHQDADGGLEYILTWESLSQAIYDADAAIDAEALPPGGVTIVEDDRSDFQLTDAIPGRVAGFTAADAAGAIIPVRVFSWYCEEGGRSFTLQSLSDAERPAVLDGFTCVAPERAQ